MNRISFLLSYFGFSHRVLAEMLGISHTFLLLLVKGKRKFSSHLEEKLAHPMFSEQEYDEEISDPTPLPMSEEWLKAQLALAQAKWLEAQRLNQENQKRKIYSLRILAHTRKIKPQNLENDPISLWWIWQGTKAKLFLDTQNRTEAIEQERKLYSLEQDILFWQKKKAELGF